MEEIDEIYTEVYKVSKEKGFTVPLLFRPYDSNRKTIDISIWCASVEHKKRDNYFISDYGETQEQALINLLRKLLEGKE